MSVSTRWLGGPSERSSLENWAAGVLVAVVGYYTWQIAAFYAGVDGPLGFDTGYVLAFGERLLDGSRLPYVDAVSQRGPVLYWVAALTQWLGGRFEWVGVRWLLSGAYLVSVLLVVVIGWIVGRTLAGAVAGAALSWMLGVALPPGSTLGLHGENIAMPLAVVAVTCVAVGLCRASSRRAQMSWLVAGGVTIALSGLTKQPMLAAVGPLALWVWMESPGSRRLKVLSGFLLGAAAPVVIVLATYAIAGELATFAYWFATYNAGAYLSPYADVSLLGSAAQWSRAHPLTACAGTGLLGFGVVYSFLSCDADRTTGVFAFVVTLLSLLAVASVVLALRFWEHHFLTSLPWLAILAGLAVDVVVKMGRRGVRTVAVVLICGVVVGAYSYAGQGTVSGLRSEWSQGGWMGARPEPLCAQLNQYSRPGSPIFIWGFDADLYITCHRPPATRFLYTAPVAGIVPPFWDQPKPEYVARDSVRLLLADLHESTPEIILDLPASLGGFSMRRIPELASVLDEDYRSVGVLVGAGGRRGIAWVRSSHADHSDDG